MHWLSGMNGIMPLRVEWFREAGRRLQELTAVVNLQIFFELSPFTKKITVFGRLVYAQSSLQQMHPNCTSSVLE